MKQKLYVWVPLGLLLVGFLFFMNSLIQQSKTENDGIFIYALDDPYIHMAIARSVVTSGVWGVTPDNFSSSSSSLLWPTLIAVIFFFTGIIDTIPLFLNLLVACICITIMYLIGIKYGVPPWMSVISAGIVAFIAPFPALIISGMEHILHFCLTIVFVYVVIEILQLRETNRKNILWLSILAMFLVTARYEGLFLVGVAFVLLIILKLYAPAISIGLAASLPLVGYGYWSSAQGWFFLPNPVLLKGNIPSNAPISEIISELIEFGMGRFDRMPEIGWSEIGWLLVFGVLFLLFYFALKPKGYERLAWMMACFLGMLVPHILFADFGWFYRYEMYLVGLGIFIQFTIVCVMLDKIWRERSSWLTLLYACIAIGVVWFSVNLFWSRFQSIKIVVQATTNIYEQQYQMARFLRDYYPDIPVAVNDIGAVAYFTEVKLIDLWGLAERDVAYSWLIGGYDTNMIDRITQRRGMEIAIVYDAWFQGTMRLPDSWIRVGQWTIRNNVVCGDDTVSFYGFNQQSADELIDNLKLYSEQLPESVYESGSYLLTKP